MRFARKHCGRARAALQQLGLAVGALTHVVAALRRPAHAPRARRGAARDARPADGLAAMPPERSSLRRLPGAPLLAAIALSASAVLAWQLLVRAEPAVPRQAVPGAPALHATAADFGKVFKSAAGGDTILLAAGDYGSFAGARKYGRVTIKPEPGAAVRMSLDFDGAANLRLEGLAIDGAEIAGASRALTIARSTFAGPVLIRADQMRDAAIVLERNRFPGIDVCDVCYEGRIQVIGDAGAASGVVLRDNVIGPGGNADGMQIGANGVQVLHNTFAGIQQGEQPSDPHTDALQLYGQSNTIVRGNYFRDVPTGIMAPDGGDHELIEDNVFDTGGYPYAIMLGGDDGSIIRHNTIPDLGGCFDAAPCGTVLIDSDATGRAGRGTIVRDNVLGRLSIVDGNELAASDHNLIAVGDGAPGDTAGTPAFAAGARPATRAGFALAAGSAGRGTASDGGDVGARTR